MNPKISIVVDERNKAIATLTGLVTVGAKVDVEISGIDPESVPDWGDDDDFVGKSLRFRIVDCNGRDLVRFPLLKSGDDSDGDKWTVLENGTLTTQGDSEDGPFVDFNTVALRGEFKHVPFNDTMDFGVIIDSIVDAAEYAVGKMKVRQWSACPTEDPTILPDWREIAAKVWAGVSTIRDSEAAAAESAENAETSASSASASADSASSSNVQAIGAKDAAVVAKGEAEAARNAAEESADIAAEHASNAFEASLHYPKIDDDSGNWLVWDVEGEDWSDTGVSATGNQGEPGPKGDSGADVIAEAVSEIDEAKASLVSLKTQFNELLNALKGLS